MLRTCHLSFPGSSGPLAFDYFESSAGHISAILNGATYPEIPDIGEVRTIVDIGANVGAASVMFAARYPSATIHACEPGPQPRAVLDRNVAALDHVRVYPVGLHDHDGSVPLYRSRWDPMSASIGASAENQDEFDQIRLRNAAAWMDEQAIGDIDVIKIDTEGCEFSILRCLAGRATQAKLVYLEYHSDDDRRRIDTWLEPTHVLASANAVKPHRGDVCYVSRQTDYAARAAHFAIQDPLPG
ncbi:MAG: FkbM family methyltransferase [Planctomycetia bacterium]